MTEVVSQGVAEGLEAVKASGRCNMNDVATVVKIARELKHLELAGFIVANEDAYRRCLAHGCVVSETVGAATTEGDEEISEVGSEADVVDEDGDEDDEASTTKTTMRTRKTRNRGPL